MEFSKEQIEKAAAIPLPRSFNGSVTIHYQGGVVRSMEGKFLQQVDKIGQVRTIVR